MKSEEKTLIALLASHDNWQKNDELARTIERMFDKDKNNLKGFHFVFTGGTFRRLMREGDLSKERDLNEYSGLRNDVKDCLLKECGVTVLPDRYDGGVTILSNLIVQRQCNIVFTFLAPFTSHWLSPENLALMRLCDLWNVKRMMNTESVKEWFEHEAKRDVHRNPQQIPLKIVLGTTSEENSESARQLVDEDYYKIELKHTNNEEVYVPKLEKQTIALIAHNEMKNRMLDFAIQYENELLKFGRVLATGTTGTMIQDACRKLREKNKIERCLSGPKGGDIEIAAEILFNRCHIVIFFIDPLNPHPHIDDIRVVFSACMSPVGNQKVQMITNEVHAREWMEEVVRHQ